VRAPRDWRGPGRSDGRAKLKISWRDVMEKYFKNFKLQTFASNLLAQFSRQIVVQILWLFLKNSLEWKNTFCSTSLLPLEAVLRNLGHFWGHKCPV
jgi:hypothetical protein